MQAFDRLKDFHPSDTVPSMPKGSSLSLRHRRTHASPGHAGGHGITAPGCSAWTPSAPRSFPTRPGGGTALRHSLSLQTNQCRLSLGHPPAANQSKVPEIPDQSPLQGSAFVNTAGKRPSRRVSGVGTAPCEAIRAHTHVRAAEDLWGFKLVLQKARQASVIHPVPRSKESRCD